MTVESELDKDPIEGMLHYLEYGEYEMAFEDLFIRNNGAGKYSQN